MFMRLDAFRNLGGVATMSCKWIIGKFPVGNESDKISLAWKLGIPDCQLLAVGGAMAVLVERQLLGIVTPELKYWYLMDVCVYPLIWTYHFSDIK